MRTVLRFAAAALAIYVALVGALFLFQRNLQYPRDPARVDAQAAGIPGLEEVALVTSDGERLVAWVVPPKQGKFVLLYLHGNAGNLGRAGRVAKLRELTADGAGVLALSYRGYGGSTGAPSEEGLHRDARAAYEEAVRRFGAERIVAYGESLGSGVAVKLATEVPLKALVLEAPFVSAVSVAQMRYPFVPVHLLMEDQFRSGEIIGRVRVPVLVLHGERDAVVPFEQGVALYEAANPPRRLVRFPRAGHNDLRDHGAMAEVRRFLNDLAAGEPLPEAQVRTAVAAERGR